MGKRTWRAIGATERAQLWERWRRGESIGVIATALGRTCSSVQRAMEATGGITPRARRRSERVLSLVEREEISRGIGAGQTIRGIARRLGRCGATVSREIRRHGGREQYRAARADARAWDRARRPKVCRLTEHPPLRDQVAEWLALQWSPQQISAALVRVYPDDQSMRVSHETIYPTLFIQARGALKKELIAHLRTRRHRRRPHQAQDPRHGSISGELSIRERPAEAADRAVPGHWEGDLLCGSQGSKSPRSWSGAPAS